MTENKPDWKIRLDLLTKLVELTHRFESEAYFEEGEKLGKIAVDFSIKYCGPPMEKLKNV